MEIQEYELKVGVIAHEQLQINDLLEYLHLEINQYLAMEVKKIAMGSKGNQKFTAAFEKIIETDIQEQEFVGFIFIYNSTKFDSLEHVKRELAGLDLKGSDETFLVLAELEGKALNIAMDQGMLLAQKYQGKFMRLSYENSEEIVSVIRSYIHTMIQNYYFPQEIIDEEEDNSSEHNKQYELNYVSKNVELTQEQENKINKILEDEPQDEPYLLRVSNQNLNTKGLLEEAEKQIDGNIRNLEKVLSNMDVHIKSRVDNEWFKDLKRTIYSKVEKESSQFSRIKLTQHFIEEQNGSNRVKTPLETILLKKRKNVLMHIKFKIGEGREIELEVFEDSTYVELAKQALRKIGLRVTEKNISNIESKIERVVGKFVGELKSAISNIHRQRIKKRKFLSS